MNESDQLQVTGDHQSGHIRQLLTITWVLQKPKTADDKIHQCYFLKLKLFNQDFKGKRKNCEKNDNYSSTSWRSDVKPMCSSSVG